MDAPSPRLNLVVLRSPDIDRAAKFYKVLGFALEKHAHGTGPEHYSAELEGGVVFEIYPAGTTGQSTAAARIGFVVSSVDDTVRLLSEEGGKITKAPHDSEWGRRAVVKDLDGHTIELLGMATKSVGDAAKTL